MPGLVTASTTYDVHTAKVARKIEATLSSADCSVEACDIARRTVEVCDIACSKPEQSLADYDKVIASGPLHGGKHSPKVVTL